MLKADAKHIAESLSHIILGSGCLGGPNFIKMMEVLKELDGYRRQAIAEVFEAHKSE
jgi:hypothetical protein